MFRASVIIAVLFSISFFVGCEDKSTEPSEEKTNTLLPLAIGNSWNYKLYTQYSDSTGQVHWNITQTISIDSLEYFLISSTGLGNSYFATRNEKDGFFFSGYDSINGFTWPFFFKYPAEDNQTYQYQMLGTDSVLNITVKKQILTIGDKSYSCYGYINQNLNPYFPFMYFAENIGLIRHKLVLNTGHGIDTTHYFIYDLQSKSISN